jgi:hypothetical protein
LSNTEGNGGGGVVIRFEGTVRSPKGSGVSEGRMFVLQDLPNRTACFGTGVIRVANPTSRSASDSADRRTESPREDLGVIGTSFGFIGRGTRGGVARKGFTFCIINQGLVVTFFPQVHAEGEAQTNVFGTTDTRCSL